MEAQKRHGFWERRNDSNSFSPSYPLRTVPGLRFLLDRRKEKRKMKRVRKIWLAVVMGLGLLFLSLFVVVQSYLNSQEFQKQFLSEISRQLHCKVQLEKIRIRIFRGADLINIQVSKNDFLSRSLIKAERLRLRYNFYEALFHRRIVLDELRFTAPEIHVNIDEFHEREILSSLPRPLSLTPVVQGKVFSKSVGIVPPTTTTKTSAPIQSTFSSSPPGRSWLTLPSIDLRRFVIENGLLIVITPDRGQEVFREVQVHVAFSSIPHPEGSGTIQCRTVDLAQKVELTDVEVAFRWHGDLVTFPKFTAGAFGGSINGSFEVDRSKVGMPSELQVFATNLVVDHVCRFLGLQGVDKRQGEVSGQLQMQGHFQGSLLQPSLASGRGQIRIQEGRLMNFPVLALLGGFLNRPDFRDLPLQKCEAEFILQSGKLQVKHFEMQSAEIQLGGFGWINFLDQTQEFQMELALGENLARWFPPKTLEGITHRPDGFVGIPFILQGSLQHPQSDLLARFMPLSKRAYGGAIFDTIFQAVPAK